MNRLATLSALFGILMTGAAAAASAEVSVSPTNGTCPSGFELQKSGADDQCVQTAGSSNSSRFSLTSFSGGDDDSHGDNDHGNDDHGGDSDNDHGNGDHDSDSD